MTPELAERLIREEFAPLPERSIELMSSGWDYDVFRVDDEWVFRFPRRAVVVPGMKRELEVLTEFARLLPVPVPEPVFVGDGFYGARYLRGDTPGEAQRLALVPQLARALRALHSVEVLDAVGDRLPFDPIGRARMEVRVARTRTAIENISDLWRPPPAVDDVLDRALALPPPERVAVCHGDLHFRQLLAAGRELTGIVDWVDVCRSDPGVDLQLLWSFVPPDARDDFLSEYGDVDEASLVRARVLAFFLSAVIARYGCDEGRPAVLAEAIAGLDRAVV
jgi:aminoglycoside phosphotransferase (APT) family kinase protein